MKDTWDAMTEIKYPMTKVRLNALNEMKMSASNDQYEIRCSDRTYCTISCLHTYLVD